MRRSSALTSRLFVCFDAATDLIMILTFLPFQDERFNRDIDVQTGYRTKALLCMPIKDVSGDVVGVAQVINKLNHERFTENDEKVSGSMLNSNWINL